MRKNLLKHLLGGGLLCAALGMASPAQAAPITLVDHNSSVTIDPDSQAGMHDWVVDGVDHLFQQWFWYRIGSNPEASRKRMADEVAYYAEVAKKAGIKPE